MNNNKVLYKVSLSILLVLIVLTTQVFAASVSKVTGLSARIVDDGVSLEWNKVSNASGYEIYANEANNGYSYLGSVSKNSVKIKGFSKGKTYKFKVRAYVSENGDKDRGSFSNEVTFKYTNSSTSTSTSEPSRVTGVKASVTGTTAYVSWNKVSDADGYQGYLTIPGITATTFETTSTSKTIQGISNSNYDYTVKIRAYKRVNGQKVYGDYSTTVSFRNESSSSNNSTSSNLGKVTGVSARVSGSTAYLSWNKLSNATGYDIYVSVSGNDYEIVGSVTKNSATLSDLKSGKTYKAKIRAYKKENGIKIYSEYYSSIVSFKRSGTSTSTSTSRPSKVTGLSADVSGSKVELDWNKVSGASGYDIYVSVSGNSYEKLGSVSKNSATITGLKSGTTYKAKIIAYKKVDGEKIYSASYSSVVSFKRNSTSTSTNTTKPSKVTGLSAEVKNKKVYLDWNKVSGAKGYEVYVNSYGTIGTVKNNEVIIQGLEKGRKYTAKIRAYKIVDGEKIYGSYSSTISFKAK